MASTSSILSGRAEHAGTGERALCTVERAVRAFGFERAFLRASIDNTHGRRDGAHDLGRSGKLYAVEQVIEVHPISRERWLDLVELFERPGPRGGTPMPGSCWCMWWRQRTGDAVKNKNAMRSLVHGGDDPGLLAYKDGVPVGWVSVGRRESFGQLMRSPQYKPRDDDPHVFAIVCFYVDPRSRHAGVSGALLDAAVEWARGQRATAIEAYPNSSPDFMGRLEAFERRGFEPVRVAGKRSIIRLVL